MPPAPKAFSEYASVVRHLAIGGQANRARKVAVLPAAIQHVAQKAEATPEFARVATALLPGRNSPNYHASEILRRSGFYNATLASQARNPRWNVISRRIIPHKVRIRTMLLLDVCWFARSRFRVAGYEVVRHSKQEIRELGSGQEVTDTFYRRERLDPEWFSQQWFLEESRTRTRKPGWITSYMGGEIVLDNHWQPLLILSLYSPVCFDVPVVVDNEKKWELAIRRFTHPQVDVVGEDADEVPCRQYEVEEIEWSRFRQFARRIESGLAVCEKWSRVKIAARRFLRATFLSHLDGEVWGGDDWDDVLLQYVFALEALLNTSDREAISEKIALRAALLAGRTDDERVSTRRFVKRAYSSRSGLAHGAKNGTDVDLPQLRDLCRRVIAVAIDIALRCGSEKAFAELLEESLLSRTAQNHLQRRSQQIQKIMKPAS